NDKGIPTEVAATHLVPPRAIMGPTDPATYQQLVQASPLYPKYHEAVNARSAKEIITDKLDEYKQQIEKTSEKNEPSKRSTTRQTPMEAATKAVTTTLARQLAQAAGKILVGILTGMFIKRKRR